MFLFVMYCCRFVVLFAESEFEQLRSVGIVSLRFVMYNSLTNQNMICCTSDKYQEHGWPVNWYSNYAKKSLKYLYASDLL